MILNKRLQNILSSIPMLCGRTVALKQSYAQGEIGAIV